MPAQHPTKTRLQPSSRHASTSQQPSQISPNVPTNTPTLTPSEFKRWRQALGLSQQRAGEKLGISRVSVGKIERGAVAVDVRTELACRWILATANWHIDVNERRSWMRALGRWTT